MSAAIQNEMERVRQEVKKWQQRCLGEEDMKDAYHRELNAALEREAALADRCPEGWQVVPKTVTPEMAEAYASDAYDTAQQCHDAVLGAAPHPGDADEVINSNPAASIARRDYEVMNKIRESMEQERDALAAHVERLKEAGEAAALEAPSVTQAAIAWGEVCEQSPAASLTQRDLIKQAEALEKIYSESQGCMIINRGSLLDESRVLRQRAQELAP